LTGIVPRDSQILQQHRCTSSHFTSGVVIGGWSNQRAVGVQTVLVNGGFVVQDGELILDAP
jgi:hypothetical protein